MKQQESRAKVVIVGGGFAGIEVAKKLRSDDRVEVVLISKTDTFQYYPALYRLVTGALPIEVSVPLATIFPKNVRLVTGTYTGHDASRRVVRLEDGTEVPYDYLVLALGSETNYFNIPGLPERSFSFKSVHEALRLKRHFCDIVTRAKAADKVTAVELLHTIVVGGGPSGVELAGDLTHYLKRLCVEVGVDPTYVTVDIIESNGRLLPTLDPEVSRLAERRLRGLGVNIFTNRALQSQEIEEIALADMEMKTGTVVWTAGTRISSGYDGMPLTERKRVQVNDMLTLVGDDRIYIAGDGAGTAWSGLAQTAIHNGGYIGSAIARRVRDRVVFPYRPSAPSFVIPIGDNWAVFQHGTIVIRGWLVWILRNMIDFKYFTSIVPFSYVLAVFKQGRKYRRVHGGCDLKGAEK
jgi:NADH:ubiquinone reductase (H+-translocating)